MVRSDETQDLTVELPLQPTLDVADSVYRTQFFKVRRKTVDNIACFRLFLCARCKAIPSRKPVQSSSVV